MYDFDEVDTGLVALSPKSWGRTVHSVALSVRWLILSLAAFCRSDASQPFVAHFMNRSQHRRPTANQTHGSGAGAREQRTEAMRSKHQLNVTLLVLTVGVSGAVGVGCTASDTAADDRPSPTAEPVASTTSVAPTTSTPTGATTPGSTTGNTGATGGNTGATGGNTGATGGNTGGTGGNTGATGDTGAGGSTTDPGSDSTGASGVDTGNEPASSSTGGMESMGPGGSTSEPSEPFTGTCTASEGTGRNAQGTGPHDVVIETNSEDGIRCGTIYRPADLGGDEKYPIFVWGEGGCSQNGLSNQAAMAEIASWGYFVVADGTPNQENACQGRQNGEALLDYITWAIAENDKPCSAYYDSLEPTKVAADGFSCGGLMAENVAGDPRFTAIGITSSGLMGANARLWDSMHAPFKIMNGGPDDVAYQNGLNDYEAISSRGIPIVYFEKTSAGHGGDLNNGRGDFNLVNLAWINWHLKGDEGATGKAFLIGPTCEFCNDPGWVFKSANIE